jgi:hypothetical protein
MIQPDDSAVILKRQGKAISPEVLFSPLGDDKMI